MSQENPASHEENPEHHGKPEPREDAAPEEGAPKPPESQDNPAPREKSPVPGGNVESAGETAAEPAAESSAEGENEGSDSEERSEGQGERSEEHAQGKRSATFWIATACAVFVLVTAHLWAAGAFQESGPAPLPPRIPIPTLSASPPSSDSEEEEENSSPESTARTNPVDGGYCEDVSRAPRTYKEGEAYVGGPLAVQVLDFDPNALGRLKASHRPGYSENPSKPAKFVGFKLRLTNRLMTNLDLKDVKFLFVDQKLKCEGEVVSLHPNVKPGALTMERKLEPRRSVEGWIYFRMDPAFTRGKIYFDFGKLDGRATLFKFWIYEIDKVFKAS